MESISQSLKYLEPAGSVSTPTKVERCLRALQVVASLWAVAGSIAMTFAMQSNAARSRTFAIGCILISAALYSVLFPLWYILKPEASR
ncbi:MAG: hypothetical protein PW792_11330 [Acidobacteriaceae bacterium]|nr:hypothetical protein [Acidobacteriaceae bacterium]